jgi:hypothetical protein
MFWFTCCVCHPGGVLFTVWSVYYCCIENLFLTILFWNLAPEMYLKIVRSLYKHVLISLNILYLDLCFQHQYPAFNWCTGVLISPTRKETSYSNRRFWVLYVLFIIIIGGMLVLFIYRVAQKNVYTLWHEKYYSIIVTTVFIQKQNWYERYWWVKSVYIFFVLSVYNKTSIKWNILTIKQNTLGSRSG